MLPPSQFAELLAQARRDGMVLRERSVTSEVMGYLKSIVEAHPGLAGLVAGRADRSTKIVHTVWLTTRGQAPQLDQLLSDLATELPLGRPSAERGPDELC